MGLFPGWMREGVSGGQAQGGTKPWRWERTETAVNVFQEGKTSGLRLEGAGRTQAGREEGHDWAGQQNPKDGEACGKLLMRNESICKADTNTAQKQKWSAVGSRRHQTS